MTNFDNYPGTPPSAAYANGLVSVGATATLVCTVPANPTGVLVSSSAACFLGGSTVTATGATGGVPLAANTPTLVPTLGDAQCKLYAVTTSGTANVTYLYPVA